MCSVSLYTLTRHNIKTTCQMLCGPREALSCEAWNLQDLEWCAVVSGAKTLVKGPLSPESCEVGLP